MRDLDTILKNIKTFYYDENFLWEEMGAVCTERNGMLSFPLGVVYEAIERAINAEAEVERLQAENAKLRKVTEAARALVPSEMYQYIRHLFDLKRILDEYDEGQDG